MVVKMRSIAIAAAVISGFAASQNLVAASSCTGSTVAYVAAGQFGAKVISGPDKFKLAGEPFSITISACESKTPSQTGPDWAAYSPLYMTGTVTSGLTGQPTAISAQRMTATLVVPPSGGDAIQLSGPVPLEGGVFNVHATLGLPAGTLASTSIAPFSQVSIVTNKSAFLYSATGWRPSVAYAVGQEIVDPSGNGQKVTNAGTSGTTAPAWNETVGGTTTDGTVLWTCQGHYVATELAIIGSASGTVYTPAAKANALLHSGAVQVITAHADGTQTVRPMQAAPVDLGASSDTVMLQFYASGVRDASEVHLQIAGQDVPVLYSGASGHFPGLDEVTVELPRSLAGMGQVDAVLTADGQTASPVRIHIQ
jgi:hypothetical protein